MKTFHKPYKNREWLYQKYWINRLSQADIAKICGVSQAIIYRSMKRFKIRARTIIEARIGKNHSEETKEKMRRARLLNNPGAFEGGEKHPGWKGGSKSYHRKIAYEVWEDYWNEKIPYGYILHHFDKDFYNYEISNLPMITYSMHEKIHKRNPNRDEITGRFISKEGLS